MSLMNYTSLIAAKGVPGSIADFLSYTKLVGEIPVVLDEAQTLLWQILRIREMRTKTRFTMLPASAATPVPANFLDPIGDMFALDYDWQFSHRDENYVAINRNYQNTSGTLGANPLTTVANSNTVSVNLPNHGFNQDSAFYTTGATALNGATIAGTFDINGITDANDFTIDITPLGTTPAASGSGGGSAIAYTCNNLVSGQPYMWGVWDETIHFDQAFDIQMTCELLYFKSLPPLSSTNQTNVLTNRYPHLLRAACQVRAASWMRDDETYNRELAALTALVQSVQAADDLLYRGAEIMTETP